MRLHLLSRRGEQRSLFVRHLFVQHKIEQQHDGLDVLEISVTDTGVGIPLEDQPKLFGAFSRVGSLRPRASEGTGLGLSIAARIIEDHKGWLNVRSREGKGTTFIITLPCKEDGIWLRS